MLILIAEDFDDARQVLKLLLQLKGHHVAEATNGLEAVEFALQQPPDLILMDLNMPVMDGFSAVRGLRSHDAMKSVPIVALSAHSEVAWRDEAIAAGCNEYLPKPIDFDALNETISRLTAARSNSAKSRERTV
jgi:two-component system, cell cycle response regulator DivK